MVLGGNQEYRTDAEIINLSTVTTTCTKPSDIPERHSKGAVGAYIDKKIMLCGGWLARKECSEYEFRSQYWRDAPFSLHVERSEAAGANLQNGSWLIIGGKGLDKVPMFTTEVLEAGMFVPKVVFPEAISGHCIEKLNSSFILIAGGEGKEEALLDSVYIMNLDTYFWVSAEDRLLFKRRGHICATVESTNGKTIVIAGGFNLLETELLDLKSLKIKIGPSLPFMMDWAAKVQLGNSFAIVGGEHIGFCSKTYLCHSSDAILEVDIANGVWVMLNQTLRMPRSKHILLPIPIQHNIHELCQKQCPKCKGNELIQSLTQCTLLLTLDFPILQVNGLWSLWSDITQCTKTCGGGTKSSVRICDNPNPENGGNPCEGDSKEDNKECNTMQCPGEI